MHCLYCGKGFRLASRIFNDPDFCRPPHRWKFHKRLDVAIRFIERFAELHPAGQAGFRLATVVLDRTPQSVVAARMSYGASTFVLPGLLLVLTGEALPPELAASAPAGSDESISAAEKTDRRACVERLSGIMVQLRTELQRRRGDAGANSDRTVASVIELK